MCTRLRKSGMKKPEERIHPPKGRRKGERLGGKGGGGDCQERRTFPIECGPDVVFLIFV